MSETRVVLGIEDPGLQEEVLHFLDRLPRIRVVGATAEGPSLARAVRASRPEAAVVTPDVAHGAPDLDGAAILVLAPRETTAALRMAVEAGARGFFVWPQEREELGRAAVRCARPSDRDAEASGRVVAVYGPRGGAGTTFVATHLAAALADAGVEAAVIDLDPVYDDVSSALGVPVGEAVASIADLAPVAEELTAEHVERVLRPHARGFRALLAPGEPAPATTAGATADLLRVLRARFRVVLVHLPRTLDDAGRAAMSVADEVVMVSTLDVLALRDDLRALAVLEGLGVRDRVRVVLNRVVRGELVPEDVERVLGLRPAAVIRADRAVPRAQDRGELLRRGSGHAARAIAALAAALIEEDA